MNTPVSAYPLFPTKHRKAFLRAVNERGRVVVYTSTHEAWDNVASLKVDARLREAFSAGWIEPVPDEDLWPSAHPKSICTYYRLTTAGRVVLGLKNITEEKSNGA
jgi:hypothetical protein